jgi:hypothetical protein
MLIPASNMALAIINMFAKQITRTISRRGFTISHYNFTFERNTSDCN